MYDLILKKEKKDLNNDDDEFDDEILRKGWLMINLKESGVGIERSEWWGFWLMKIGWEILEKGVVNMEI